MLAAGWCSWFNHAGGGCARVDRHSLMHAASRLASVAVPPARRRGCGVSANSSRGVRTTHLHLSVLHDIVCRFRCAPCGRLERGLECASATVRCGHSRRVRMAVSPRHRDLVQSPPQRRPLGSAPGQPLQREEPCHSQVTKEERSEWVGGWVSE
jgi:hypothetical protein